jgi:hypothetical protein
MAQIKPLAVKDRLILQDFDQIDLKNLGRPFFWSLDNHIIAIEQMICADEIEIALKMFDQVPAWYREPENYPEELTRLKKLLYQNLYDQYQYAADEDEAGWTKEKVIEQFMGGYCFPRGEVLRDIIARYNAQGQAPWVCELSPSHGPIPIGLLSLGLKFNFYGKNLNHAALVKLKGWLEPGVWRETPQVDQPRVFVCCESLEHAFDEESLYRSYEKLGLTFDEIVLSVPYGCMGGGLPNWKTRPIGHIRGYTVSEFTGLAQRFFPGYQWQLYKSVSMVLHGVKA